MKRCSTAKGIHGNTDTKYTFENNYAFYEMSA